jgi:phosphodiesterase/alkaline phosphatase D-like protein
MFVRVGPLVRATSATSAVVWAELAEAREVTLYAQPVDQPGTYVATTSSTVTVGGRHYVAPQLQDLQPGTWYRYHLAPTDSEETLFRQKTPITQCFRTFSENTGKDHATDHSLRIAYGSCRKATDATTDVLDGFGNWLSDHQEEREQSWPHVLLLIGDQIYADDPPPSLVHQHPHLQQGAQTFEDFAQIYEHVWTYSKGVRQALAALPTLMIFDDHEITNNWNGTPTWRARMLQAGKEQLLVDGQIAYWLYQGWGNLTVRDEQQHPLLRILHEAAASSEDALERLRTCVRAELEGKIRLSWHYEIPTTPAIFVTNTRTERPALPAQESAQKGLPARITSLEQTTDLRRWASKRQERLLLIISSVPVLLPPAIGLAEYIMGKRLWYKSSGPLRWLGRQIARFQQWVAEKASFDHWPLYEQSWHELQQIWQEQQKDLLVLSGDVHFSYAIKGTSRHPTTTLTHIYQLVCTPLQNALSISDRRKIELQSSLKQSTYGGLQTRVAPLQPAQQGVALAHNLLYENVLAMITLRLQTDHTYTIQQEYLGLINNRLETFASVSFPEETKEQPS